MNPLSTIKTYMKQTGGQKSPTKFTIISNVNDVKKPVSIDTIDKGDVYFTTSSDTMTLNDFIILCKAAGINKYNQIKRVFVDDVEIETASVSRFAKFGDVISLESYPELGAGVLGDKSLPSFSVHYRDPRTNKFAKKTVHAKSDRAAMILFKKQTGISATTASRNLTAGEKRDIKNHEANSETYFDGRTYVNKRTGEFDGDSNPAHH